MSIAEAARLLGISRAFAYRLARSGRLPNVQFGTRRVVPVAALRHFANPTQKGEE